MSEASHEYSAIETAIVEFKEPDTHCCLKPRPFCCGCCGARVPFWACCAGYCTVMYICVGVVVFYIHHYLFFPSWLLPDDQQMPPRISDNAEVFAFEATHSDGRMLSGIVENATRVGLQVVALGGNAMEMYGTAAMCSIQFVPTFWQVAPNKFRNCPCPVSTTCSSPLPVANLCGSVCPDSCGTSCYTTSYRGYPPNRGWTSSSTVTADLLDLVDHALQGAPGGRVLLLAWSLGTAAALQLAAANPDRIAGLMLLAPFTSVAEETRAAIVSMAGTLALVALFPWLWIFYLDPWDSVAAMRSLPADIPVAVVSPSDDALIPPAQHRAVFDASRAKCRAFLEVPGADHNSIWRMLDAFQRPKEAAHVASCSTREWAEAVYNRTRTLVPS